MALIECPDCKKKISDAAPACPNCGRPFHNEDDSTAAQTTDQRQEKKDHDSTEDDNSTENDDSDENSEGGRCGGCLTTFIVGAIISAIYMFVLAPPFDSSFDPREDLSKGEDVAPRRLAGLRKQFNNAVGTKEGVFEVESVKYKRGNLFCVCLKGPNSIMQAMGAGSLVCPLYRYDGGDPQKGSAWSEVPQKGSAWSEASDDCY
jgi:hypothetical protein